MRGLGMTILWYKHFPNDLSLVSEIVSRISESGTIVMHPDYSPILFKTETKTVTLSKVWVNLVNESYQDESTTGARNSTCLPHISHFGVGIRSQYLPGFYIYCIAFKQLVTI